jgi:hypothetical protein
LFDLGPEDGGDPGDTDSGGDEPQHLLERDRSPVSFVDVGIVLANGAGQRQRRSLDLVRQRHDDEVDVVHGRAFRW